MPPRRQARFRFWTSDPRAVQDLFDQYVGAVFTVIRAKMNPTMRSANDSEDFLQKTRMKLALGNFEDKDFETPQAFLAYMCRVAEREVQQVKRQHARCTEGWVNQEKPLAQLSAAELERVLDKAPDACAVQIAEDRWQRALAALPPVYRYIALKLRDGFTQIEIAKELELCERTVGRAIKKLRELLLADSEEGGVTDREVIFSSARPWADRTSG